MGLLVELDGDEGVGAEVEDVGVSLPPKKRLKNPGLELRGEDVDALPFDDGISNVPNDAIDCVSGSFGSFGGS